MNTINQAQRRAMQYWFVDGLGEIFTGLVYLLLSILFLTLQFAPLSGWGFWIFFLLTFGASYGLRALLMKLKARSTYPRTGYAAPLNGWENKRAATALIIFTILLMILNFSLIVKRPGSLMVSPLIAGVIIAFITAWTGYQSFLIRFYYLAAVALLAGVVLAWFGPGDMSGAAIVTALMGLIMLASGIRTRRTYLRQNPMPSAGSDGR